MLRLSLRVREVTDMRGLTGASVEVRPEAVPRWFAPIPIGDPSNPTNKPLQRMVVGTDLGAGPPPQTVVAGPDGRLQAVFDMGPSFAAAEAARFDGSPPTDVAVRLGYGLRYGSFARDAFVPAPLAQPSAPKLVLTPDADVESTIFVDLGFAVVGHTTETSASVWVTTAALLRDGVLEVRAVGADGSRVTAPVALLDDEEHAGLARLTGLTRGTRYAFDVTLEDVDAVLTSGSFVTDDADAERLRFGFVSCNGMRGTERWRALAARDDLDLVLHMGDQIYEYGLRGDTEQEWLAAYSRRYRHHWRVPATRAVLRRTSNYMILDDHDVKDDLGVVPVDPVRRRAALQQYRLFQQSHGPRGPADRDAWYAFRRGPAAFFVLDVRTQRVEPPAAALAETEEAHEVWQPRPTSVVLGAEQLAALDAWARSDAVRDADLVFVVSPTPFAWVPIPQLLAMIEEIEQAAGEAGSFLGGVVGGLVGGAIGGPFGAVVGKEIGEELGEAGAEALADYLIDEQEILTSHDMADTWVWPPNQPDLVRLLRLLFDLAADADRPGGTEPHARGVFVLGGDVHAGALHDLTSGDPRHLRNRSILQVISSGIAQQAPGQIRELVEHFQPGQSWPRVVASVVAGTSLGSDPAVFAMDTEFEQEYLAVNMDALWESNFGTFDITRLPGPRRVYDVHVAVNGRERSLLESFRLDLDAGVVEPQDLIGGVGRVEGEVRMHRVQRHGTGFGPSHDRLDGDVVVRVAGLPDWSFGLPPHGDGAAGRGGVATPARPVADVAMEQLLRDAELRGRPVRLEYERTGPRTGTVLRIELR